MSSTRVLAIAYLWKGAGCRQDFRYCSLEAQRPSSFLRERNTGTRGKESREGGLHMPSFICRLTAGRSDYRFWWRTHHVLLNAFITAYASLCPCSVPFYPTHCNGLEAVHSVKSLRVSLASSCSYFMLVFHHHLWVAASSDVRADVQPCLLLLWQKWIQSLFKVYFSPAVMFDTHFSR